VVRLYRFHAGAHAPIGIDQIMLLDHFFRRNNHFKADELKAGLLILFDNVADKIPLDTVRFYNDERPFRFWMSCHGC
jgi:hypothetical protein